MTYVYVLEAEGGLNKIGVAGNALHRRGDLATACPFPLELRYTYRASDRTRAIQIERAAHHALSACRTHGEWFRCPINVAIGAVRIAAAGIQISKFFAPTGEEMFVMRRRDYDRIASGIPDLPAEERPDLNFRRKIRNRRAYDALLARGGDPGAEDRMTALMAEEHLAIQAAGDANTIPLAFAKLVAEHGSPVTAARKWLPGGCTQAQLAEMLDISQGHLSDIERGRRQLTEMQRIQIAAHTGVHREWLV